MNYNNKNKRKRHLITIGILAILTTMFLYLIDGDPAYPKFSQTAIEFTIATVIIFGLFTFVYFLFNFYKNLKVKRKSKKFE